MKKVPLVLSLSLFFSGLDSSTFEFWPSGKYDGCLSTLRLEYAFVRSFFRSFLRALKCSSYAQRK